MERIYFDHAATTSLDKDVLEKMLPYFSAEYGNADSLHALGRQAMNAVDQARDTIARLIGAKPNEIYFTSGVRKAIIGRYSAVRTRKDNSVKRG
ncbi:MAG: aminotransferase class V-fold PLP-dependent enzyme [Clostridia bacterium]|nr:aminotransferase class V-fold PLP-dependent enzyme [Clostridia bacterium]